MSIQASRAVIAVGRATRVVLLLVVPLVVLMFGLYLYARSGHYVSTDNAYVKADIVAVSAEVPGRVIEVAVEDNAPVETGALLFRIDPTPFEIARARAQAQMDVVRTEVQSLRAEYRAAMLERREARERIAFLARQLDRLTELRARGMVRGDVYDEAQHNLDVARVRLASVEERINRVLAGLSGEPDLPAERHPRFQEARAAFDAASNDIAHCEVRAAVSGIVSNMRLQPGEHVAVGVPVFSLISGGPVWVEANFKETQLTHMRPGQPAQVIADAYPEIRWEGVVEAIAPATGAEFAVLPPQNATGNWVKVVQRVTVRIRVDPGSESTQLRSGLSVNARVDIGRSRGLPRPLQRLMDAGYLPRFLQPDPVHAQGRQ
ncbi:MAG: HlyD family secretion protein [Burkholderiales bacterium]